MTSGQNTNTITLRYFAWVREKVGLAEEEVCLPADVATVAQLMNWLKARGETIDKPLVVRLDGNNAREGRRILDETEHDVVELVDTMDEAARRVAELAAQGA